MKTQSSSSASTRGQIAFTLTELMVSTSIFVLLLSAIIYTFMFGLSLHQTTKTKLGVSDDARRAVIKLTDEIRSSNKLKLGTGNRTNFFEVGTNAAQMGNAIQIYPTTDTNSWIRYYCETNPVSPDYTKLCRTASTNVTNSVYIVAQAINPGSTFFTSEDSSGRVLSNNVNNRVIGMSLQFYALEYPSVKIGPGAYYESYQLHTRITRRRIF